MDGENQYKDERELLPRASFSNIWHFQISKKRRLNRYLSERWKFIRNEGGTAISNRPCVIAGAFFAFLTTKV